jgi:hypothetical protein
MRPSDDRQTVRDLARDGLTDSQISRLTGIPRSTVRYWLRPRVEKKSPICERCGSRGFDFAALPPATYGYLLGLYLGDGCLSRCPRDVWKLRIACCVEYPQLLLWCEDAIRRVFPNNRVHMYQPHPQTLAVEVNTHSKHAICLFPQHGPGPKHHRPIKLADWQAPIVEANTEQFLRGLIHSDGCRSMNTVAGAGKTYSYPRYTFSNASDDIRALFTDACDRLGIEWRRMNARNISVARRASVARLDEFVGPKG